MNTHANVPVMGCYCFDCEQARHPAGKKTLGLPEADGNAVAAPWIDDDGNRYTEEEVQYLDVDTPGAGAGNQLLGHYVKNAKTPFRVTRLVVTEKPQTSENRMLGLLSHLQAYDKKFYDDHGCAQLRAIIASQVSEKPASVGAGESFDALGASLSKTPTPTVEGQERKEGDATCSESNILTGASSAAPVVQPNSDAADEEIAREAAGEVQLCHSRGDGSWNDWDEDKATQIILAAIAKAKEQDLGKTPVAGNHDCEYDSEKEDAMCKHCGLTSGEAVRYFERRLRKPDAPSDNVSAVLQNALPASSLPEWIRGKITDAKATLRSREQMEETWRSGDDKSWEAASAMHSSTAGTKPMKKADRLREADTQGRIAAKCRHELEMFVAVEKLILSEHGGRSLASGASSPNSEVIAAYQKVIEEEREFRETGRRRKQMNETPQITIPLDTLLDLREAFDQRYDGAEDSETKWMGQWLDTIDKLLPDPPELEDNLP